MSKVTVPTVSKLLPRANKLLGYYVRKSFWRHHRIAVILYLTLLMEITAIWQSIVEAIHAHNAQRVIVLRV